MNRLAASTLSSEENKIDLECTILSHQAQVVEVIGEAHEAIDICRKDIDIRTSEVPQKKIYLAHSVGNLGIMHTSANCPRKALEYFQESRQWWKSHYMDQGENRPFGACILIYEARCMMDVGDLRAADDLLHTAILQEKEEKPPSFGTMAT